MYVGIDIAATTFTAAWMPAGTAPTPPVTHPQRPGGFAALRRQLAATGISPAATLVVLEATGNHWAVLAVTLHTAGYRGSVINPLQAHHFAKADPLDARNLAELAAALRAPGQTASYDGPHISAVRTCRIFDHDRQHKSAVFPAVQGSGASGTCRSIGAFP